MKSIPGLFLSVVLMLGLVGVAWGEGDPKATGTVASTPSPVGGVEVQGPVDAQGEIQAATTTDAEASANAAVSAIRERAKKASAKACTAVEKKLTVISDQIDAEVQAKGHVVVAGRVASEFGVTAEAMAAERNKFDVGLGAMVIAHTLKVNSKTAVTTEQLFLLQREGLGWARIAYGLNLKIDEVATAVKSESQVAMGRVAADGKPAAIQTGVASSKKAGVHAGPAGAGTASSVGVGVQLGK